MKIIQNTAKIENGEIIIKVPEDLTSQEVNVIIIAEEDSQNSTNVIRNHKAFLNCIWCRNVLSHRVSLGNPANF